MVVMPVIKCVVVNTYGSLPLTSANAENATLIPGWSFVISVAFFVTIGPSLISIEQQDGAVR